MAVCPLQVFPLLSLAPVAIAAESDEEEDQGTKTEDEVSTLNLGPTITSVRLRYAHALNPSHISRPLISYRFAGRRQRGDEIDLRALKALLLKAKVGARRMCKRLDPCFSGVTTAILLG
jgi:hypothetical protein